MKIVPFVRTLKVKDKLTNAVVPFVLNDEQLNFAYDAERQLARRKRVRTIVLKARQLGISTITEGMAFQCATLFDEFEALIVAHDSKSSQKILKMTNRFHNNYRFNQLFPTRFANVNTLAFANNMSEITTATAKNIDAGRGGSPRFLHGSEVAFWDDGESLMTNLSQSVPDGPNTFIILESTAKGVGNYFHKEWEAAVAGDSEYTPKFYPWWRGKGYTAEVVGISSELPGRYTDAEIILKRAFKLTDGQLAWRRWAIRNKTNNDVLKFMQEYPSTPEEAFIATGTNVFPLESLKRCFVPSTFERGNLVSPGGPEVKFRRVPNGALTIFKHPSPDRSHGQYIIGADPTHTLQGDFAVAQVLNRRTMEQVAVYRQRIDPGSFADDLFLLGRYYNDAIMCPEKEGPGYLTVGKLLGKNYPRMYMHTKTDHTPGKIVGDTYGWGTNKQTKSEALGVLLELVVEGINPVTGNGLMLHDPTTYSELTGYVALDNGRFGNANGSENDDTVMALAIAATCHFHAGPVVSTEYQGADGMSIAEERLLAVNDMMEGVPGMASAMARGPRALDMERLSRGEGE